MYLQVSQTSITESILHQGIIINALGRGTFTENQITFTHFKIFTDHGETIIRSSYFIIIDSKKRRQNYCPTISVYN